MKKTPLFIISFLIITACFSPTFAIDQPEITATHHVLENRMNVIIDEMPTSSTVALYALIKTGSATEDSFLGSGITHLMEHMLFKGTPTRPKGTIAKEVQALGGVINASTSFDYTMYFIQVPSEQFQKALAIFSDMLINPLFDEQELLSEKEVVLSERRLYKDRPERVLSELTLQTAYLQHPYRYPIIGHEDLFKSLNRDHLVQYYNTNYAPNNIIFIACGNITQETALPAIKQAFGNVPAHAPPTHTVPQEPEQITSRFIHEEYPTPLTRVSIVYQGVSVLDNDMYALDCLAMILGKGKSSRLHQSIVKEKQLAHAITASNFTPRDRGLFEIEAVFDYANYSGLLAALEEELDRVRKKGVQQKELDKIKRQLISQDIFGRQTPGGRARAYAFAEFYTGDFSFNHKYIEQIQRITSDDIRRVAQKYLRNDKRSIILLSPPGTKQSRSTHEAISEKGAITKQTLPNGLTVLLKADPTNPIITFTLAAHAGTRHEDAALSGISELTAHLWAQETQALPAKTFAEHIERLGATLNGFSGRNTFGLRGNFLKDDTRTALDLIYELLTQPGFSAEQYALGKKLTHAAIDTRDDNSAALTRQKLQETLFKQHYFHYDTIGTHETIDAITLEDIKTFFTTYTTPRNMTLSVYGDIDVATIMPLIEKRFRALPEGAPITHPVITEQPPEETRIETLFLDKSQALVMFGFQAPAYTHPDHYTCVILSSLLASPLNSRLFNKVRDELGEAYRLGASYTPGPDMGMLTIFVNTTDESLEEVTAIVQSELKKLQDTLVTAEELAHTKTYLKGTFAMQMDTVGTVCFISTMDELYGLGYNHFLSYDQSIDAVTAEDIRRFAQNWLKVNNAAIVYTRPKTPE